MLVDGDRDDFVLTRELFAELSGAYSLDWVSDYETGLRELAHGAHDVYLLDYRLGSRDGLELLREGLRAGCKAPIIILTGQADRELDFAAMEAGAADYLIKGKIDASKPAKGWRSAWRSIRHKAARNDEDEVIYPNLDRVRFHDLRHTAVTVMAEKGLPDQTIMAQVGHISPEMLRHYSPIRRQALNAAAAALEPTFLRPITQPDAAPELLN